MDTFVGAATQVLLKELYDFLGNEGQSLLSLDKVLRDLKEKVKTMIDYHKLAQRLDRDDKRSGPVKRIMDKLRELVYDADDIIVGCKTRADYEKISRLHGWTVPGLIFPITTKNRLEAINDRIQEVEKELKTYLNLNALTAKIDSSNDENSRLMRHTSHVLPEPPVGLEKDTEKIKKLMKTNGKSRVIGIVGMGGLGKTTLAQNIYQDKDVTKHYDKRIWVSVSQKLDVGDILRRMVRKLEVIPNEGEGDHLGHIQTSLNNKKYLIVMDDVWSSGEWWNKISERLAVEGDNCEKTIIITTRNEGVAEDMRATHIHKARELKEDESWALFSRVVDANREPSSAPGFKEVGKDIVKKCGGNPLAIKAIAELLSTKMQSLRIWEQINKNFRVELHKNTSVLASLRLSYDDLRADLKHCLLCFSIYPEDKTISAEQLVYWWVSEGFVQEDDQKSAIEVGYDNLSELVSRCLVEAVKYRSYDGRVYDCRMHDMVRELIINMAKDEAFSSFDHKGKQILDSNSHHLGYTSGMDINFNSKLRAILLLEDCPFPFQQKPGVNSLRVLDLSCSSKLDDDMSVKDLLKWIKSQECIAYINLWGVRKLKKLPNWIKRHQNLKILVITECTGLNRLPHSITSLQNLMVLDVENCNIKQLPRGFGRLTKLQVFSGFMLAKQGRHGTNLGMLKGLAKLRVLRMILCPNVDIPKAEETILSELPKLEVLSIDSKDERNDTSFTVVNKLVPPPSLQELSLRSYSFRTTPNWLSPSSLGSLVYLYIDHGQLQSFSRNFWDSSSTPWKIECLCLKHLFNLKLDWEDTHTHMPHLRYMEISECHGLTSFPCNEYGVWKKDDNSTEASSSNGNQPSSS